MDTFCLEHSLKLIERMKSCLCWWHTRCSNLGHLWTRYSAHLHFWIFCRSYRYKNQSSEDCCYEICLVIMNYLLDQAVPWWITKHQCLNQVGCDVLDQGFGYVGFFQYHFIAFNLQQKNPRHWYINFNIWFIYVMKRKNMSFLHFFVCRSIWMVGRPPLLGCQPDACMPWQHHHSHQRF